MNLGVAALDFAPTNALSRAVGRLMEIEWPQPLLKLVIQAYVQWFGVDLVDADEPARGFRTFNDFFTRRLKPAARVVSPSARVVSPVDGTLLQWGEIGDGALRQIKDRSYSVRELLGSDDDAVAYRDGAYVTLYLSPRDYHRVHSPVDGLITGYRYIPGRLFPVNQFGVSHVPDLFSRNERLVIFFETGFGKLALVMVGATIVGRITVAFSDVQSNRGSPPHESSFAEALPVNRGDEVGAFNLGSTVVLLFQGLQLTESHFRQGAVVRVGQVVAE